MLRKVLHGCFLIILNLEHQASLISTMPTPFRARAVAEKSDFAQENHEFCGYTMVHLLNIKPNQQSRATGSGDWFYGRCVRR